MKSRTVLIAALLAFAAPAAYAADPMVGGAPMSSSKTIVQNASAADNLTTLVSAVKQAGLVATLSGPGPFTVFAPTNAAFDALPKSTVDGLMKPDMKPELKKILTYHVMQGRFTTADIMDSIKKYGGKATFTSVQGEPLTFTDQDGNLFVTDAKGDKAKITIANVEQSNGIVDVINKVLMPS